MQLGGGTMLCVAVSMVIAGLITPAPAVLMLVGLVSGARSFIQYRAGRALTQGEINGLKPLRTYVVAGVVHSGLLGGLSVFLTRGQTSMWVPVMIFLILAAWPLTVLAFSFRPSVKAVAVLSLQRHGRILPEDRGVQGAAALMAILGMTGFVVVGLLGWGIIAATRALAELGGRFGEVPTVPITLYILIGALMLRSGVHAVGGLMNFRRPDSLRFQAAGRRYFVTGLVSCVAVVLYLLSTDNVNILVIFIVVPLLGCFMVWPAIINGIADRNLPALGWDDEEDLPPVSASHDGGLSTIACFLLAGAVMGIVMSVAKLVMSTGAPRELAEVVGPAGNEVLQLILNGIAVWVSIEFLSGKARAKVAAGVYLVVSIGITLFVMLTVGQVLEEGGLGNGGLSGFGNPMLLVAFVMPLILPLIALAAAFSPRPSGEPGAGVFD